MKTAEEVLKSKLDVKIAIINNPDYTFNKIIEAMEEYAEQSRQADVSGSLPHSQEQAYQELLIRVYNEFKSAEWVSPIVDEIKEHIIYPIQEDGRQ